MSSVFSLSPSLAIEIDRNLPARASSALRLDNGPEFIAVALADWAEQHGVTLEFIKPGKPMLNGFIERLDRSYREAVLDMFVFGL